MLNETASSARQSFSIKDLKCEEVVVFTDRAEVKRSIKTKLNKGENELVINNVSNFLDQDSIRINGEGGATVLDVICQTKKVEKSEAGTHEKVKELNNEIQELTAKKQVAESKSQRLDKQQAILNDFANTLAKAGESKEKTVSNSKENVSNFMDFLDSYTNRLEQVDSQKADLRKEIEKINEQINVARQNLNRLRSGAHDDAIEVVVLLEAAADNTEVTLFVSYVLYNASWTPKYDIRVSSRDKLMVINYYGMITQSTGEDWNDTRLSLSTAVPSIGGNVPELKTSNVKIKPKPVIYPVYQRQMKKSALFGSANSYAPQLDMAMAGGMMEEMTPAMAPAPIMEMASEVNSSNVGSTSTFSIPRNATIPADNNTHKVSIGVIDLKPTFEYESVPKMNNNVYIKAKVVNTSQYAMLAGPANVFFENNFVSKTQLKPCSPTEEFSCSLGVDPAIRVEYKPVKHFTGQTGLINKYTSITYTQVIEIKNTMKNAIKILVSDNLPYSSDEKILVKLIEPNNLKATPGIKLNKSNNLEFDLEIGPVKTEEITIKYTIEHPADQEIEFY